MTKFKAKECEEYPEFYEIPGYSKHGASKEGEILTKKTGNATLGGLAGRYRKVSVYANDDSDATLRYVHDLVCRAFNGKPKKDQVVLHKDSDRENCKAVNLKWGDQSENIQQMWDEGQRVSTEEYKGKFVTGKDIPPLYHIMFPKDKAGTWFPKVPDGSEFNAETKYTDGDLPRISFCPTIQQCALTIWPMIEHMLANPKVGLLTFQVYMPEISSSTQFISPKELTKDHLVWDAHVTEEWITLEPLEVRHVGSVHIFQPSKKDLEPNMIHPYDDKKEPVAPAGPKKISFKWIVREEKGIESFREEVIELQLPASAKW